MIRVQSEKLFAEALKYIPGGVNSPVRAFRAVGGNPFFVNRASGSKVWDVDGNELIDYVCTWGPAILGHAHPKIISAVKAAAEHGTSFGIPNPLEVTMAKLICELVPSVKKVRMTSSGTEACMSAIRLARGFTRRDKIIKFDGCYHGHVDSLLVKAGSGALTFGHPDSAGVPAAFTQHTIVLPFNDVEAVKAAFAANKNQIAGIIIEPVPGNAGLYLPKPGYLEFLSEITKADGALLIFDEVMVSSRARRRAGTFRHHAGFVHVRQNHRRRVASGCVWRTRGDHGLSRAARPRLSGGDVERESHRDGGRSGGAGGTGDKGGKRKRLRTIGSSRRAA
jgi:glutamate-1-semialdehyde 2,1-aminomutase